MSKVAIVMGSTSDLPVMQDAIDILKGFDIEVDVDIVSAHRTPEKLFDFSKNAHTRGYAVIIAGAGGAAHLPAWLHDLSPCILRPWLDRSSSRSTKTLWTKQASFIAVDASASTPVARSPTPTQPKVIPARSGLVF